MPFSDLTQHSIQTPDLRVHVFKAGDKLKQRVEYSDPMIERRFGRFTLTSEMIRATFPVLLKLMGSVFVLQADYDVASDSITYRGVSEFFEPVAEGQEGKLYDIEFEKHEENASLVISARFVRR